MLKLTVVGNLGRDAEVKQLNSGMTVISFSVAHTDRWKTQGGEKRENTTWVQCSIWRKQGESIEIAKYLTTGRSVAVEGSPSARAYNDNEGEAKSSLELRVFNIELMGLTQSTKEQSKTQPSKPTPPTPTDEGDDDLPF